MGDLGRRGGAGWESRGGREVAFAQAAICVSAIMKGNRDESIFLQSGPREWGS